MGRGAAVIGMHLANAKHSLVEAARDMEKLKRELDRWMGLNEGDSLDLAAAERELKTMLVLVKKMQQASQKARRAA